MAQRNTTRRDFLKTSAVSVGSLALPLWWRKAHGQESANDRLTIGSIGTGVYDNRYTGDGRHPGRGMTIA